MFLRSKTRKKDGKEHRYWSVVENRRVADGRVVQRHVLYLGEINDAQRAAWCRSIEVFDEDRGADDEAVAGHTDDGTEERRVLLAAGASNDDVAAAYRAELKSLGDAGCRYVQLDDTNLAYLCDEKMREGARQLSRDLSEMAEVYNFGTWKTLRHVTLPQLAPFAAAAARSGLALVWKIVLVVEALGGHATGVGHQIHAAFGNYDVPTILAYALAWLLVLGWVIVGACLGLALYVYMIYLGVKAYGGVTLTVPVVTDWIKKNNWA
mgnify:CR=1 FL=1